MPSELNNVKNMQSSDFLIKRAIDYTEASTRSFLAEVGDPFVQGALFLATASSSAVTAA
jgi:hypothetical protein